jgi:hypothetical protein
MRPKDRQKASTLAVDHRPRSDVSWAVAVQHTSNSGAINIMQFVHWRKKDPAYHGNYRPLWPSRMEMATLADALTGVSLCLFIPRSKLSSQLDPHTRPDLFDGVVVRPVCNI